MARLRLSAKAKRRWIAVLVGIVFIYCSVLLIRQEVTLRQQQEISRGLMERIAAQQEQNDALRYQISSVSSTASVARIAREQLNLLMPDEIKFLPASSPAPTPSAEPAP